MDCRFDKYFALGVIAGLERQCITVGDMAAVSLHQLHNFSTHVVVGEQHHLWAKVIERGFYVAVHPWENRLRRPIGQREIFFGVWFELYLVPIQWQVGLTNGHVWFNDNATG